MLVEFKEQMPADMPPIEITNHLLPLTLDPEFAMYMDGKVIRRISAPEDAFLRTNRTRLKNWLSSHIDIRYGKRTTRIEEEGETVTLHFADGTTATGNVLVGADGVNSFGMYYLIKKIKSLTREVRRYLCEGKDIVKNLPLSEVIGEVTLNKEQYERQLKLSHSAYLVANKPGARIFVGLNAISPDAEEAYYYWILSWNDESAEEGEQWSIKASAEEQYRVALEESNSWPQELGEIVRLTKPENMMVPPLTIRDVWLDSLPNRRVTLLGDAAHAMSPCKSDITLESIVNNVLQSEVREVIMQCVTDCF
jgi:2-polyprenyl-6-methoxyphenol hydroxylase-like FAD-dependent oxidoreductase